MFILLEVVIPALRTLHLPVWLNMAATAVWGCLFERVVLHPLPVCRGSQNRFISLILVLNTFNWCPS
jgi:hypothetical protein